MRSQQEQEAEILSAIRVFARSAYGGPNVVADMSSLIKATSEISLSNLDQWERFIRWNIAREMQESRPPKWQVWKNPTAFLTWVDLCSEDGFRRERTLRVLSGGAPNRFFFSMAIRRLNDWVLQVKDTACERLPPLARESDPEVVADVLCATLAHWNSWGRMSHRERQTLLDIVSISEVVYRLKTKVLSSADGPMTTLLSQLGRVDVLDSSLEEIARGAVQPSVRAKAYRSLLEGKVTWFEGRVWEWTDKRYCEGHYIPVLRSREISVSTSYMENIQSAALDASSIVRRVAGEMLIRDPLKVGSEYRGIAERLAADHSPSVSERGKFALRSLGP